VTVYLLKIDPPLAHARHYIGWCEDGTEARRLAQHVAGRGARLLAAAVAAGCKILPAHLWPGADRHFERRLKNRADTNKWCPCCRRRQRPLPRWDGIR
jgi:hypothetical protein